MAGKGFYSTNDPDSTLEPMLDPEEEAQQHAKQTASAPKL